MPNKIGAVAQPDRFKPFNLGNKNPLFVATYGQQPPLPNQPCRGHQGLGQAKRLHGYHHRSLERVPPLICVQPSGSPHEAREKRPVAYIDGRLGSIRVLSNVVFLSHDTIVANRSHPVTIMMQTRDCPVILILNDETGAYAVVHGMRDLLAPDNAGRNIVSDALEVVAPHPSNRKYVHLYATAGISAAHFPHDDPEKVRPFLDAYGEAVFEDVTRGTLDLYATARETVIRLGVSDSHCWSDGLCTFRTGWLGSRRAKKSGPNSVFILQR